MSSNSLLQAYLKQLQRRPMRTKSLTSGTLNALQELAASVLAGDKDPITGSYITNRIPLMALYGFFISAPVSHYLYAALQRVFRGKRGLIWKLLQILASNLLITPIVSTLFLSYMIIISGTVKTSKQLVDGLKKALPPVLKASWVSSPVVLAFAQAVIPEQAWVPFFNFCYFFLGTYNNMLTKKKRLHLKKSDEKDSKDPKDL